MTTAFTEPVTRVRGGWTGLLFLANLGLWLGVYAPLQVLLPRQAELLAAGDKEFVFGLVTGVGAAVSAVTNPLVGLLSDRTTSRWGRRHPWTAAGALVGAAGLAVLATAGTVLAVVLGWCLVMAGLNGMLAALTSAVPDRVPVTQRAGVGGFIGISQMLGTVIGAVLVTEVVPSLSGGYLVTAAAVLLGAAGFVLFTKDVVLPGTARPPFRLHLWIPPRRHPDFAWMWACHFAVNLGNALGTLYLLFFLKDAVHRQDPEGSLLVLMALYGAALVLGALVIGWASDASGRRKPYALVACAAMALAALVLVGWQTWTAALVAAPLLGVGFGVYWAVAIALLTRVLPAATDRAKDLGVVNIANALPQVVAPLIASALLGWGYPALFAASALATLAATVFVTRVRAS